MREDRLKYKTQGPRRSQTSLFLLHKPLWYSSFLLGFHLICGQSSLTLYLLFSLWICRFINTTLPGLWSSQFLLPAHRSAQVSKAMAGTGKGSGSRCELDQTSRASAWKIKVPPSVPSSEAPHLATFLTHPATFENIESWVKKTRILIDSFEVGSWTLHY